jgi:transposase
MGRFSQVGDFSSYCRCVPSRKSSNEKFKGEGNKKNGNRYLSWAFAEAAHFAAIHSVRAKKYYDRKKAETNFMVASRALANKLSRAVFYMLRDKKPFNEEALYC